LIKEEQIEDLEFLRSKLIKYPMEYISYNQLKGYNKEDSKLFKQKFDELSAVMLNLGIITEINSPIAGQRMFEKTDKIHLIDIKTIFQQQKELNEKENLEKENLILSNVANKWLIKTKWVPHILAFLSLLYSVTSDLFIKKDFNELKQRIEKLEGIKLSQTSASKTNDSFVRQASLEKKDSLNEK